MSPSDELGSRGRRRVEVLRRLGMERTTRFVEFDDFLELLAAALGADAAAFTIVDQDVARIAGGAQVDMPLDRRRSLAEAAICADDGRASVTVASGSERAALPVLAGGDAPVTMVAVAVSAPDGERIGALVAHWVGEAELGDDRWVTLARASLHASYLLELRADAAEYRRFIELSPDPVLVLDIDGNIELANPALASLLGHEHAEGLTGAAFLEIVSRRDRARVTAELARVLFARRRTIQLDVELISDDGRTIPTSVSAGHLRGARRHLQLVVHDLSDRLRGEDQRAQLSEQLARAQRLDAVGQVASGLAHDLNNLLVIMVSNLALARESLASAEEGGSVSGLHRDLDEIDLAVGRATSLTRKLLQFARRDDGAEGSADVTEVVEAVIGLLGRTLPPGVRLVTDVPDELSDVAADPVQLERVLLNLVINARDAVDGHGTITIRARPTASVDVVVDTQHTLLTGRSTVRLEVVDDGVGMEERVRARAFEPLFTTKPGGGGSGLGLPTVLAFADEIDGTVTLDSAPGRGTTVALHLPVDERLDAEVPVGMDVPVAGARVVLVDPGERTRRVIARMLQGAGYRITAAGSAEEALQHLAEEPADLVITELSLPGMTGARLVERIRDLRLPVQVVALASVDAPRTLEGTPILVKPFSHSRLLRTVERVLADR